MPSPSLRLVVRIGTVIVALGVVLVGLPPAVGTSDPPSVIRSVPLNLGALLPDRARVARGPDGSVRAREPTWTRPSVTCAPIRFTLAGLVWEQGGDATVPARLAWGARGGMGRIRTVLADPDEAPDPGSPEGSALAGTPPIWTGDARCLRFRLRLPAGATLAALRAVFVNTSGTADAGQPPSPLGAAAPLVGRVWGMTASGPSLAPAAAGTVQPHIITRAEWGADEHLRRCGPNYADDGLKAAFVHHTVNSNGYSRAQADDLIRAIYAYHVKGRKFCDIAYNFLIDRFGRIYEGRYGGIDQPVIGGHAMGFNTGSTGVAALGTFETKRPSRRVLAAFKRLLAWRLDVAHLRPTGTTVMTSTGGPNQKFEKGEEVTLPVIVGHRDTGYTACPGGKLYAKLGRIRTGAQRRGLPKLWDPLAEPSAAVVGTGVRFTATLSAAMPWTVELTDAAGGQVWSVSGSGTAVDATWNGYPTGSGSPAPPGTYAATMRAQTAAGTSVREAVVPVTVTF